MAKQLEMDFNPKSKDIRDIEPEYLKYGFSTEEEWHKAILFDKEWHRMDKDISEYKRGKK